MKREKEKTQMIQTLVPGKPVPPNGGLPQCRDRISQFLQNKCLSIHKPYPEKGEDTEDGLFPSSSSESSAPASSFEDFQPLSLPVGTWTIPLVQPVSSSVNTEKGSMTVPLPPVTPCRSEGQGLYSTFCLNGVQSKPHRRERCCPALCFTILKKLSWKFVDYVTGNV